MKTNEFDNDRFVAAVAKMPTDALSTARQEAASGFLRSGFPTTRHEDWRYTNLADAIDVSNRWLRELPANSQTSVSSDKPGNIDAYWVQVHNGLADCTQTALPVGVSLSRLANDVEDGDVRTDTSLRQLNTALLLDGIRVTIDTGVVLDKPLGFLFIDSSDSGDTVTQNRLRVIAGPGASASIIEAHESHGADKNYSNIVVDVELAADSKLDYLRIQQRARHHIQTNSFSARILERAELQHHSFDLGGSLTRNELVADLVGCDATVGMFGLFLAGQSQHIDNHTKVIHSVGPTASKEEYRGILNRKSKGVFNGKAVVREGADGTDAQQANHNLLLSGDSEVDTKPELEIYADDVKCSHGATVGQLDKTALFYLRSRGLDLASATALLTRAFAARLLSNMPLDAAAEHLSNIVDVRLNQLISDTDHD